MSDFSFEFPDDFSEYEWLVVSKGYCSGSTLTVSGKRYRLNFFDPVRLAQDIESDLQQNVVFFEPNLVVIRSVTREAMQQAAAELVRSGQVALLTPE